MSRTDSIVTLGVDDLARSRAFYEALGWELAGAVGDGSAGSGLRTHIWDCSDGRISRDAGLRSEPTADFGGITLAISLESEADADTAFAEAVAAGART